MRPGYLYAIDLGDGIVKIGMTKNPKKRIRDYVRQGQTIENTFITGCVLKNPREGEKAAMTLLSEYLHKGLEYFKCDFGVAVKAISLACEGMETCDASDIPVSINNMKKRQLSLNDDQEKHIATESKRLNINVNAVVVMLINNDMHRKLNVPEEK